MAAAIRLAVVGAGLVGRRHVDVIRQCPEAELAAVIDPAVDTEFGVPTPRDLDALFATHAVDGVVLSTPTALHLEGALRCITEGLPVLVEKPLAATVSEARRLTEAASRAGVPVLVGHHRRHNPIIAQARDLIAGGALGDIRAVQATCWFYKPDAYFDAAPWRKALGAGPVSVNLVHDVDLMRHFCGEVVSVQAQTVPSARGFANEDLAAALLRFESGAIATMTVSDSVVAPWSWEMTAREYPVYPATDQSCYLIGGSLGALSVPDLRLWRHERGPDWWQPITATSMPRRASDPLANQIAHFVRVIRGDCDPLVPAVEGLRSLQVIEAIQSAARSGATVPIDPILLPVPDAVA